MSVQLVPVGPDIPEPIAAVLKSHEDALRGLQQPDRPMPAFGITAATLPPAASYQQCVVLVSDLGVLAVSNGAAWINQHTGSAI